MTRQQQWARDAWTCVNEVAGGTEEAKYRTFCMKAPVLIQQSGLVQALAFLRARDEVGRRFVDDLARVYRADADQEGRALMETAQQADDLMRYMALTRDLIGVSIWFRRFAQSDLQGEEAEL